MQDQYIDYFQSPVGLLEIRGDETGIVALSFDREITSSKGNCSPAIEQCKRELKSYFEGTLKQFNVTLHPTGTAFQSVVWEQLQIIPYGNTISYLELSRRIGNEKSVRAVGAANGKNPIGIIVPCHRVIGANNQLIGYSGGLWRKQWLLEHEARFAYGVVKLF